MLNESQKVIEATRRVSGQSTFDDMEVESTIGARGNLVQWTDF